MNQSPRLFTAGLKKQAARDRRIKVVRFLRSGQQIKRGTGKGCTRFTLTGSWQLDELRHHAAGVDDGVDDGVDNGVDDTSERLSHVVPAHALVRIRFLDG